MIDDIGYNGKVNFKLKINGNVYTLKQHNRGLDALFKAFAYILLGLDTGSSVKPTYFCLRQNGVDLTTEPQPVSSSYYSQDLSGNHLATFSGIIAKESIKLYNSGDAQIYLLSSTLQDLAVLTIPEEYITALSTTGKKTHLVIEWQMYFTNGSAYKDFEVGVTVNPGNLVKYLSNLYVYKGGSTIKIEATTATPDVDTANWQAIKYE